jgi:hypothetical protein
MLDSGYNELSCVDRSWVRAYLPLLKGILGYRLAREREMKVEMVKAWQRRVLQMDLAFSWLGVVLSEAVMEVDLAGDAGADGVRMRSLQPCCPGNLELQICSLETQSTITGSCFAQIDTSLSMCTMN